MKIYFAGSIRGGRKDAELYRRVISALKEKHQVLTEHVGDLSLSAVEDKGDKIIYEQDTAWLRECDVVVAECTQVSLGVGYELAYAEAHNKEVHIFYRPKETQLSAMLAGNEGFHIHRYENADEILAQVREMWN
jgi:nucleoside 2-deoxyribosyltransferase